MYTKGPWKSDTSAIIRSTNVAPEYGAVAKVYMCTEWKDNADLIAAAPELYEFAKVIWSHLNMIGYDDMTPREKELCEYCKHVISKAEGK